MGCTVTNDRKAKAGFCTSNLCRFCEKEPESLEHIIECSANPLADVRPDCPDQCGPNFKLLGIVESPPQLVTFRLRISCTSSIPVKDWTPNCVSSSQCLWTDGSCENNDLFWETSGGFAVVNQNGVEVASGPVCHISLSSYSCELWAIIWAFSISEHPIECRTDSKAVADQIKILIETHSISPSWMHFEWWGFLRTIYLQRLPLHRQPLSVSWIPAHVLENLPCELISPLNAASHNTTCLDIFLQPQSGHACKESLQCKQILQLT